MKVSELIDLLRTFPQNAPVIQTMMSDYVELEKDAVTLIVPDGIQGVGCHKGHWMMIQSKWRDGATQQECVTVVHIAGN